MRPYLIVIVLLLVIFGAIGGYVYLRFASFAAMDFSPPPVTVAAAHASVQNWERYLDAVGTIRAVHGVELSAESSGEVTALHFDSGDQVAAGALLLKLNDEIEQAEKQQQLASLELEQIRFQRNSRLIAQQSIPASQYDSAKANLARAKAALAETEARIANKRIHAPFAGTLGIRRVALGDYLEPGTVIATLQDQSALEVDFTLPARYAPQLRPGLMASLTVNAYPQRLFPAELTALDARVDPGTRNLLLRARLLAGEGLLPGMFATLQLDLEQPSELVTVPETAVTYSLQGSVVYVITETGSGALTASSRIVQVGATRAGRVAILAGLSSGERVVTAGQNKLYRDVIVLVDETVSL